MLVSGFKMRLQLWIYGRQKHGHHHFLGRESKEPSATCKRTCFACLKTLLQRLLSGTENMDVWNFWMFFILSNFQGVLFLNIWRAVAAVWRVLFTITHPAAVLATCKKHFTMHFPSATLHSLTWVWCVSVGSCVTVWCSCRHTQMRRSSQKFWHNYYTENVTQVMQPTTKVFCIILSILFQ